MSELYSQPNPSRIFHNSTIFGNRTVDIEIYRFPHIHEKCVYLVYADTIPIFWWEGVFGYFEYTIGAQTNLISTILKRLESDSEHYSLKWWGGKAECSVTKYTSQIEPTYLLSYRFEEDDGWERKVVNMPLEGLTDFFSMVQWRDPGVDFFSIKVEDKS